jgi:plasmid stability protein
MTLTLNLPSDVESELQKRAIAEGLPVEAVALEVLSAGLRQNTLASLYAYSLSTDGDLTALSAHQEDVHDYSADELAAMQAGQFERPL